MKNRDIKLQELASRLVQREVYYCISSLMYGIGKIMWNCPGFQDAFGEYPDDMMELYQQDDWETPGDWFIMEHADFDDLEKIADNFGDWAALLEEHRVPNEIALPTHWVCDDCISPIVNGDLTGVPEDRLAAVEEGLEDFPGDAHPTGEADEFSRGKCDCCGTTLAGRRHAFSDGSDTSDDLDDRIKWAAENRDDGESLVKNMRLAVSGLVEDWEWVGQEFNLDADTHEVYEHWIVSDWLAARLKDEGHVVGEFAGLTVWGRQTTGQSISMDGVIQRIAGELWSEELEAVEGDGNENHQGTP